MKTRFKTLALTLVFAALMPVSLFAQSDGFFRSGESENYQDRDASISSGMTNQQFNDAPLGSGLLILVAAGAGYAVTRRKRNNKNVTFFLAITMLLGLTQCKKNVETIATNGDGMTNITLRVANDSKHGVNPSNGQVFFGEGDIIYVAKSGEGAYLGYLTCGDDDETFSGTISTDFINTGDDLYFYFVGNLTPEGALIADNSEQFFVYINNQGSKLPVISQGHVEYNSGTTSYSCELKNKCSLVKFKLPEGTSEPVYLCDMRKKVNVNMYSQSITYTNDATGEITLFRNFMDDTEKCAILLPSAAESEVTLRVGSQYYTATMPALTENYFYSVDAIPSVTPVVTTPYFSVSATKKVLFSTGNLQYNGWNGSWRFADPQYSYETTWNSNSWVDLMGYGTWWTSDWAANYPTETSSSDGNYGWEGDFTGYTLDGHDDWFTLTSSEWSYLLGNSAERVNKYGDAKVNGVVGIVILPDEWATPAGLSFTPGLNDNYSFNNTYTSAQWSTMQEAGAVFLPASGYREGTTIKNNTSGSEIGAYWAKDYSGTDAYCLWLQMYDGDDHAVNTSKLMAKHLGYYVRLVRPYTAK